MNFREYWLGNKKLCEQLMKSWRQDIREGIESLDFNKRMFSMV